MMTPQAEAMGDWTDGSNRLAGLGLVLLSYVVLVTAVGTLAPFQFAWPRDFAPSLELMPGDLVLNLVLLFPAGFLFRLTFLERTDPRCLDALVFGTGLSVLLELAQVFLPLRAASPIDIVANGAGAWAGALTHAQLGPWFDRRLEGQLTLQLPLVNVLYLMVPMLWLNGLAAQEPTRILLALPLGFFGGAILVSLWRNRLRHVPGLGADRVAIGVAAWFGLSTLPALLEFPIVAGCEVLLVFAMARFLTGSAFRDLEGERRFELPTVRRTWPLYACYLAGLAVHPWVGFGADFAYGVALSRVDELGRPEVLGYVEYVTAFALIGYLVAELGGRAQASARTALVSAAGFGFALAACLEALRGFHPAHQTSLAALVLVSAGAIWGAAIYRSQLAVVRGLLSGRGFG